MITEQIEAPPSTRPITTHYARCVDLSAATRAICSLLCVLALLILGGIMVQSASMSAAAVGKWGWSAPGLRHAMFAASGIAAFLLVGTFDYARLGRKTKIDLEGAGRLARRAVCGAVPARARAARWTGSERRTPLAADGADAIATVGAGESGRSFCFIAWWLTNGPVDVSKFFGGLLPTLVPVVAMCLLVVIQDFGTAALIMLCALAMLLAGRVKLWHLARSSSRRCWRWRRGSSCTRNIAGAE